MNLNQYKLGDLNEKSLPELKDLLLRQEKLLKNVKFISKLPDKGERIKNMAARLESAIESRKYVDDTTDLFERMALDAAQSRRYEADELAPLRQMANRSQDKVYVYEGNSTHNKPINSYDRVIRKAEQRQLLNPSTEKFFPNRSAKHKHISELPVESLNRLKLEETIENTEVTQPSKLPTTHPESESSVNKSFEKQIADDVKYDTSKVGEVTLEYNKTNYLRSSKNESESVNTLPSTKGTESSNRSSALESHVDEVNTNVPRTSTSESQTAENRENKSLSECRSLRPLGRKLKHNYDDSLLASDQWHCPNIGPIQVISIEESILILEAQRQKQESLQAQQAAERLTQRFNISMKSFDPEGSRHMIYRNIAAADTDDDSEEDDDAEEKDYPND